MSIIEEDSDSEDDKACGYHDPLVINSIIQLGGSSVIMSQVNAWYHTSAETENTWQQVELSNMCLNYV